MTDPKNDYVGEGGDGTDPSLPEEAEETPQEDGERLVGIAADEKEPTE